LSESSFTALPEVLYGAAVVLEEFGKVMAQGGSGVVISSQSGHRLPALTIEQNKGYHHRGSDGPISLTVLLENREERARHHRAPFFQRGDAARQIRR
jgi:hypothetical protein